MSASPVALAVVIPTYNRAPTIRRAVTSVLRNPLAEIELIVVDDCSTDDTLAILSGIVDPRLVVVRSDTHGFGNQARNLGVARSRAPLIAFLDSDDEFLPGRVERLIAMFDDRRDLDVVVDGFQVIRHNLRRSVAPPSCAVSGEMLVRLLVAHALPLTNSAIAVRRSAFDAVGGFDASLRRHQDRDLLLRLARRHCVGLGSGTDVVKYQGDDSISRDPASYVAGLDELVARHPVFEQAGVRDVLGYLIARALIREAINGRPLAAWRIAQAIRSAQHLRLGPGQAVARYLRGRRVRRRTETELASLAPRP